MAAVQAVSRRAAAEQPVVFVVDDDEWIHELLTMALEDDGYQVVTAHDGREALELLERCRPRLILLDWMMPLMNGPAFAAELRRRGLRPGIPILVVTADSNARGNAEQIGAEGYVRKPFDLGHLLDQVARLTAG
jgi:CheY-like chemotaxis protein